MAIPAINGGAAVWSFVLQSSGLPRSLCSLAKTIQSTSSRAKRGDSRNFIGIPTRNGSCKNNKNLILKQKTMKKLTSVLCGAVAAVCAAATAAFGGISNYSAAKAENAAENQKFALDTGAYTLKMDDSVTMDVSYAHGAYLYNKRDTSGNIRLKFKTVSYSSAVTSAVYNGLVRGSSKDIAYAYVPMATNHWYVFGDGRNTKKGDIYSVDEYTDIIYDVTAHAFSVKIGKATPVMAKMFQSADASVTDAAGTGRIAWDANNAEAIIKATLTDFSITDADGYNLGVAMSRTQDARMTYSYEENFYGYAGKTVTVKYIGDGDGGSPLVYGSDGTRLTIPVTSLGKGEYSFVMPKDNVRLVMKRRIENSEIYGTYANAESGDYFVLGEQSYKSINGVKTNIDLAVYTGGIVDVIDGENITEGEYTIGKLVVGNTVYKKFGCFRRRRKDRQERNSVFGRLFCDCARKSDERRIRFRGLENFRRRSVRSR